MVSMWHSCELSAALGTQRIVADLRRRRVGGRAAGSGCGDPAQRGQDAPRGRVSGGERGGERGGVGARRKGERGRMERVCVGGVAHMRSGRGEGTKHSQLSQASRRP
jgi:hypothetical protein